MKKGYYLKCLGFLLIVAFCVATFSLGEAQVKKEPIRIGVVDSYSGAASVYASDKLKGGRLYLDQVNAQGGVLGRQIEFIVRDDEAKPDLAVKHVLSLYGENKVDFCIGILTSSCALAVSEWARQNKKLFFAWDSTTERLTSSLGHRYIFHTKTNTDMDGNAMAQFWSKQKYTKFHTIGPDYEYGHKQTEAFKKHLTKLKPGVQYTGESWPKLEEIDYTAYITSIMQAKPEVLYGSLVGGQAIAFIKQAKPYGFFEKIKLSNLYAGLSVLVPLGNSTPEGIYTGISYSFDFVNTPENTAFVKAHKDKYGVVPSDFTVNGYVGIKTLVEGIKKANTLDQEKVIDAMEGITVDTPGGPMTVRKFDHQAELGMFIGVTKKSPEFKDFLILEKLDYIPGSQTITPLEEVKALREKK